MTSLPLPGRHPSKLRSTEEHTPASLSDSPGGDVLEKYPTLPDNVFRRIIRDAMTRQNAFDNQKTLISRRIADVHRV